jgi:Coenzyme PQQ synthesis protein D (PqqD)
VRVRSRRYREVLAIALLAIRLGACDGKTPGETTVISGGQEGNEARVWEAADTPRRHPEAVFREVGEDEGLVFLPSGSEVQVLNDTGSRVFSLLDGEHTLGSIARTVTEEFEVDYATALEDIIGFVKELDANDMLANEESVAVPER